LPIADSAFFVDAARPVTQMRFRWDTGFNVMTPDRAEYFWARSRTDPSQLGPGGKSGRKGTGKGIDAIVDKVDYMDLNLYMEGAAGRIGIFIETSYRDLDPQSAAIAPFVGSTDGITPDFNKLAAPASGFADMVIGTKSLLLDCELLQLSFQFKTFLPVGNFTKGLGTGHVALEPGLLLTVKMTPDCYLQSQLAYWIPIGGDDLYQANVFHAHASFNKLLWMSHSGGLQLIGTAEINEWSVLGGNYTETSFLIIDPATGKYTPLATPANTSMVSAGPGLRLFICDKIDLGVGSAFAFTGTHWAEELIRAEFRWRF
jgi:hypothetical protein